MDVDTAIAITLRELKNGTAGNYGYDLYTYDLAAREASSQEGPMGNAGKRALELDQPFSDAGWELCRRGLLRPGVKNRQGQAVGNGGYSLTVAGRKKLAEMQNDDIIIMQPGSLGEALATYANMFGEAFLTRSQEAIKCRNAEAWLACCAMAGAAAESVLLAVAIAKTRDATAVYAKYNSAGGRQKVINGVVGGLPDWMKTVFTTFTGIISAWRDEAAHGAETTLSTANADESLRQLLHMCQWVKKSWDVLTA